MCTVSYIPDRDSKGFILTSNRDERDVRETSAPAEYGENGSSLWFPKDKLSGGSWIAVSDRGRVSCLLNGAFVAHEKQAHHTLSRGVILKELAAVPGAVKTYFLERDLNHVEPFTIVSIEHQEGVCTGMTECIWDGTEKHYREPDPLSPYIWSSVTLYDEAQRNMRKEWFYKFFTEHRERMHSEEVLEFHRASHVNDPLVNVIMEREGGLRTVSITQVTSGSPKISLKYLDLLKSTEHKVEI